jgi:anti-sigma B factor antagonist
MPLLLTGRLSAGVWILSPSGPMTLGSGSELLRETLIEKFDAGFHRLLIDCSAITTVDSAGLGEIVSAYSAIVRRGGALKLLHPSKRLQELLAITRLDTLLETYDDESAALRSLNAQSSAKAKAALDDFLE